MILKEEHELRSSMEKRSLLATRAVMRRGRRYRKVRYRKPKWRHHTKRMYFEKPNRRGQHWRKVKTTTQSPRPKGWLPPSLQSKCDHHFLNEWLDFSILCPDDKVTDTLLYVAMDRFSIKVDSYYFGNLINYSDWNTRQKVLHIAERYMNP